MTPTAPGPRLPHAAGGGRALRRHRHRLRHRGRAAARRGSCGCSPGSRRTGAVPRPRIRAPLAARLGALLALAARRPALPWRARSLRWPVAHRGHRRAEASRARIDANLAYVLPDADARGAPPHRRRDRRHLRPHLRRDPARPRVPRPPHLDRPDRPRRRGDRGGGARRPRRGARHRPFRPVGGGARLDEVGRHQLRRRLPAARRPGAERASTSTTSSSAARRSSPRAARGCAASSRTWRAAASSRS